MEFRYGMRLRGFSPGCQPKDGFLEREDDLSGRYYDILVYNRKLTDDELRDYELNELKGESEMRDITNEVKDFKKFYIIPKNEVAMEIHSVNADDAMSCFAFAMDSDMNTYFRAVTEEEYNEMRYKKDGRKSPSDAN